MLLEVGETFFLLLLLFVKMSSSLRKRKALSLKDKIEILREVDKNNGLNRVQLAKQLNIPVSTLSTIVYNRKKIEENASACGSSVSKRLRVQAGKFSEVEDILLKFFIQCRAANIPVSGPMLIEKAKEIALKLDVKDAFFSTGWLHKFKARHGISCKMISGEGKDVPQESVEDWLSNVGELINGYDLKDIFNADETGLFYNLLPKKTLAFKGEDCKGGKKSKDRLTVLLCANADGSEKIMPVVIGKSQKPRCMKNIKSLPVTYLANRKAWMSGEIFAEWLKKMDLSMKRQNRKILLFVDQCTAHPQETGFLQNIRIIFFPPNCISRLQPLDLGIIKNLKDHYRAKLTQLMIENVSGGRDSKKLNVLEAINIISEAWAQVKSKTVKNCFVKAGFLDSHSENDENDDDDDDTVILDEEEWKSLQTGISFEEYVKCDDEIMTSRLCTIDELVQENIQDVSSDEDDSEELISPSFSEALNSVETLRKYFMCHTTEEKTFFELNSISNALHRSGKSSARQTSIKDFFFFLNFKVIKNV